MFKQSLATSMAILFSISLIQPYETQITKAESGLIPPTIQPSVDGADNPVPVPLVTNVHQPSTKTMAGASPAGVTTQHTSSNGGNQLSRTPDVSGTNKNKPPVVLSQIVQKDPTITDFKNDFECIKREVTKKIEFHYTAETYSDQKTSEEKIEAIYRAHTSPKGKVQGSGIGYHYVIAGDGHIYRTRPVDCVGIADAGGEVVEMEDWKGTTHNAERIHIAFIGDDKPTKAQTDSMVYLANVLAKRFDISKENITSHAEEAPKNHKESLEYWFGSRKGFLDKLTISGKKIYRNGQYLDYLQHAWTISHGDMDFIKTIEQESRWDPNAKGDKNVPRAGDYAFGFCQYNTRWNSEKIAQYKKLSSFGKVDLCWKDFSTWRKDGVIANQLHGYEKRNQPRNDIFTLK